MREGYLVTFYKRKNTSQLKLDIFWTASLENRLAVQNVETCVFYFAVPYQVTLSNKFGEIFHQELPPTTISYYTNNTYQLNYTYYTNFQILVIGKRCIT